VSHPSSGAACKHDEPAQVRSTRQRSFELARRAFAPKRTPSYLILLREGFGMAPIAGTPRALLPHDFTLIPICIGTVCFLFHFPLQRLSTLHPALLARGQLYRHAALRSSDFPSRL